MMTLDGVKKEGNMNNINTKETKDKAVLRRWELRLDFILKK